MSLSLSPLFSFRCACLYFSLGSFSRQRQTFLFFFHHCLCERDLCCCHCHGSSSLKDSEARTHTHNLFHPIPSYLSFFSIPYCACTVQPRQGPHAGMCVCVILLLHAVHLFSAFIYYLFSSSFFSSFFYSNAQMNVQTDAQKMGFRLFFFFFSEQQQQTNVSDANRKNCKLLGLFLPELDNQKYSTPNEN